MASLDQGLALATCERALRQLLGHVLRQKYGSEWLLQVSTEDQRRAWKAAEGKEVARRQARGVAAVPAGPFAYAEFWQLLAIASKVWDELLTPALGKKADTFPLLKRVDDLRNPVGHSRELLTFEADLLSGIAGDIRNRVTIYLSSADPQGDIYPRIESVRDQFGTAWEPGRHLVMDGVVTLRLGDRLRLQCRGTDPQGRDLLWWAGNVVDVENAVMGSDVELEFHLNQDKHVGERTYVSVYMASTGRYHRRLLVDGEVTFSYRVDPPLADAPEVSDLDDGKPNPPVEELVEDVAPAAGSPPDVFPPRANWRKWMRRSSGQGRE